ncbi:MAG: phosphate uptake regulator PhoU, partial [Gemmatimonadota bacterium]
LAEAFPIASLDEFDTMAEDATGMLRDAISAFVDQDPDRARAVLLRDDKVDRSNDAVFRVMLALMAENANAIVPGLQMMLVARNLERVADLATNLAEDVIYIVEARTIKHHVADHARWPKTGSRHSSEHGPSPWISCCSTSCCRISTASRCVAACDRMSEPRACRSSC